MTTRLLVLSDIFGLCAGLERLLADLSQADTVIDVIDPYQTIRQQFVDEAQAYAAFTAQCGHEGYAAIAAQALQSCVQPFDLAIGFSAGATALWRALATSNSAAVKQAVLFYPGQIHQHLALTPAVPVQVIFGHSEPHFAVAEICTQLQQKPGVSAVSTGYAHGFINPASKAFNKQGYQQYLRFIVRVLSGEIATAPTKRRGRQTVKEVDRTLLAYIKKPTTEAGYIDLITTSKNGLSYIYQGEHWARQAPIFGMGKCRNSKGEEIEISPLSRHYSVKDQDVLLVTDAAKPRYQLWLMKKLKQSRQASRSDESE
ncbi:dienelactone hydrolase family protein [Rheinheimera pleomorphica]|uniref:dienelactone hydrolase family protein n=1 Tax=Rheinheimera pleomorphica TaxID=2703963 RepID=UPI00141E577B|nr:dienelactone hydrolase family protein [Rheinheimera pleomorphica]